jgi:hypothetical protein
MTIEDDDHVSASDLRFLLNEIIKIFAGNGRQMRQVRTTLLRLMRDFARQELKRVRGKREKQ